ncbi:LacI family DNA-binding transcriptional regulator [Roseobacteraceae bacterium S113]
MAQHASVSVATVSRVLNAPQTVSSETRRRVEEAIDSLSFRRSAAARAINSGRSYMVGALIPTLDNSIFARFLVSLEIELDAVGLSLIVASTRDDTEIEEVKAGKLIDIGAEALIVSGVSHSDGFGALVARADLPVVQISYHDPAAHLPTVGYDNAEAVALGLAHLRGLGHERIALIHGPTQTNDRTRARVIAARNLPGHDHLHFEQAALSVESARTATRAILAAGHGTTAILCFSDVLATGALFELQSHGLDVPRDISLMGMENLPSSAFTTPPLTSVDLQVSEMGTRTAQQIFARLEGRPAIDHVKLETRLVVRHTTARPCGFVRP